MSFPIVNISEGWRQIRWSNKIQDKGIPMYKILGRKLIGQLENKFILQLDSRYKLFNVYKDTYLFTTI